MNTNILSRGFTLTAALRSAVLGEIEAYCSRHGNSATSMDVRLFDSSLDVACSTILPRSK